MILSGKQITENIANGSIVIQDFNDSQLNPNSYNLRLHNELTVYKDGLVLDMKKPAETYNVTIPEEGLVLAPGQLYLGRTVEWTETHKFVPLLIGRSSIGRLGLWIHVTAGFGDVGFKGYWTMEMTCIRPVRVYPYVQIAQIYYHEVTDSEMVYGDRSKYQDSNEIRPSLLWKELKELP